MTGEAYHDKYLVPYTLFVHEFNDVDVGGTETRLFVPYTGNEHNRRKFVHLLLRVVAAHEEAATGRLPDYFEPCVGSGQIFMNHRPAMFARITLGDINPFLLSIYLSVQRRGTGFIDEYVEKAEFRDQNPETNFAHKLDWLGAIRPFDKRVERMLSDQTDCELMAIHYLWMMNRSQLMPKLRTAGGVVGAKLYTPRVSADVRLREKRALSALRTRLTTGTVTTPPTILRADLAATMARAESCPSCVVVVDAPFPKFSYVEGYTAINCYGTEDGEDLQTRLLSAAKKLFDLGRPVIICNYATPSLILAYQEAGAYPIFSFKSPKDSTIYMLAVFYKGQGTEILRKVQAEWF